MRHWIWLLALVVAVSLACTREKDSDVSPAAADTPTTANYTLSVTFEGLVGYLNQKDQVWALLPKARPNTMPSGFDPKKLSDYPEHHAFLKVNGANIKNFGIPGEILIPIEGKAIQITEQFGEGSGIPSANFRQATSSADKLDPSVLNSDYSKLAARVKLPLIKESDWLIDETENSQTPKFVNVNPVKENNYCKAPDFKNPTEPRVQAVTWQMRSLTGEATLKFSTLGGDALPPLVLVPVDNQSTIEVWIVNKVGHAITNPKHAGHHSPAYRWFYNLSVANVQSDCTQHYYPQGSLGGNRCPQKLYTE